MAYHIDEETGQHGIPLSSMRLALVRAFSAVYLFKVTWYSAVETGCKLREDEGIPATKEKSDPGGKSDGRTSGIFTSRRRASLQGTFENEWM